MSRADSPRYPFSRCFFVPLTRRGHSTSISEVSANADGDEGLTEMASAMQSSASRLMTRCEMSPPLARPGMGLSARPLRCCLFIESPTLPFLLLSSYSRHGISCWRTRNTEGHCANSADQNTANQKPTRLHTHTLVGRSALAGSPSELSKFSRHAGYSKHIQNHTAKAPVRARGEVRAVARMRAIFGGR